MAAYALRDNDLNVTNLNGNYTSDPYVLVQFFDAVDNEFKMKVYNVVRKGMNKNVGILSYEYEFEQSMDAGEPVIPFYPLHIVIGATPCAGTYGQDLNASYQTFWKDHKGTGWAISGNGEFNMYFFYPFDTGFWWPPGSDTKQPGDCVAWLPDAANAGYAKTNFTKNVNGSAFDYTKPDQTPPSGAPESIAPIRPPCPPDPPDTKTHIAHYSPCAR